MTIHWLGRKSSNCVEGLLNHFKETVFLNSNQIAFRWYYSKTSNKDSLLKYLRNDIKTQLLIEPDNSYLQYNSLVIRLLLWSSKYSRELDPKYLLREIKTVISNSKIEKKKISVTFN